MVGHRSGLREERTAQTAIADAVIALIVLTIASAVVYSSVSSAVTSRSQSRQRADLRTVALESSGLPLEASCPFATYIDGSSGTQHILYNLSGEELFLMYFELEDGSNSTGGGSNLSGILGPIRSLYEATLEGRSYAVHAFATGKGTQLLFSSELKDGQETVRTVSDIPNPRIVTQKTLPGLDWDVTVELYLWK